MNGITLLGSCHACRRSLPSKYTRAIKMDQAGICVEMRLPDGWTGRVTRDGMVLTCPDCQPRTLPHLSKDAAEQIVDLVLDAAGLDTWLQRSDAREALERLTLREMFDGGRRVVTLLED